MDAVVFDLFGTLVPSFCLDGFEACVIRIAEVLELDRAAVRDEVIAQSSLRMDGTIPDGPRQWERLARALGADSDDGALRAAHHAWSSMLAEGVQPKPGAVAMLATLQARRFGLALATDASSGVLSRLDESPLGRFFQVRACSAEIGVTKPHEAMYLHVLEGLGVRGERCLYVGDGNSQELPGARRHGMTTVWVDNGDEHGWPDRFCSEADHRVTHLEQILPIVDSLA